ncbi:MAG: hypothetical protein NTV62_04385 [Candidatus Gribaldobacteria bacterium]|nr:hypothetical protein [Candidatus Gribaldobacteria bacterium]
MVNQKSQPKSIPSLIYFKKYFFIIISVIILALFLILFLLSVGRNEKLSAQNNNGAKSSTLQNSQEILASGLAQIVSCVGEIQEVSDGSLKILLLASKNRIKEDQSILVKTTRNTQYLQMVKPRANQEDDLTIKTKEIKFSDLKVGDQILAFTADDLSGKTTIEASLIQQVK